MKISVLNFVIFFAVFLSIYGGAHFYIFWRLAHDTKITGIYYRLFLTAFLLLFLSFPLMHFAFRHLNSPLMFITNYISSLWVGLIVYLFIFTLAFDILLFAVYLFHFISPFELNRVIPAPGIRALIIVFLAAAVSLYGIIEAAGISVTELNMKLPGFPKSMNGFKLVQISDVHLGMIVQGRKLEKIVKMVNELNPDVIVITGDLVDEQAFHMENIEEPLKKLRSSHGVYAVTGNHEFYAGIENSSKFMKESGIDLLRNRWVNVDSAIQIVGMDDPAARYTGNNHIPPINEIMKGIDRTKPVILLYHTPVNGLDYLKANGINLQLSGHTHKGQMWPFRYFAKMMYKTPYGLYTSGNTAIYVSDGTGTWGPPMRVGARPEITLFRFFAE